MGREPPSEPTIGPIKRFGRYTLIKKLATGGMAEIWLARQSGVAGFNRFVVIKKILSHLAEEETFRNMFLDEARMSAQLQHPNIVQVYDLGEADQTYFIAMEFIMGENLAAIAWRGVKRAAPLSPVFAARIMADACKALDYAHRCGAPTARRWRSSTVTSLLRTSW
jgi:serine/threonine-protein kinase